MKKIKELTWARYLIIFLMIIVLILAVGTIIDPESKTFSVVSAVIVSFIAVAQIIFTIYYFEEGGSDDRTLFKVAIMQRFTHGMRYLAFEKTIMMPAPPFYGLQIPGENEEITDLRRNDYQSCEIYLTTDSKSDVDYEVSINHKWPSRLDPDEVTSTLKKYRNWDRIDGTNEMEFIEFLREQANDSRTGQPRGRGR